MPTPVIIIDTREQKPYDFRGMDTERAYLATGDYSLKGYTDLVSVERKSKPDAWMCARGERRRFIDCLQRLAVIPHPAIVIECSQRKLSTAPPGPKFESDKQKFGAAKTVMKSYISWAQQYRIPVFYCDNQSFAEATVIAFLMSFWKHEVLEGEYS